MDTTNNNSTRLDWILTLVFLVLVVLCLIYIPAWFWVPLPFFLTYLVKAFRSM